MLLLLPLALTTLLLLLALDAQADHSVCWWNGPGEDPEAAGYEHYCDGSITDESSSTARYVCNFRIGIQKQVADYGKLGAKQLEFGTACNYGGYFLGKPNSCCCSRGHACIGGACCCDHIAMCLGDRDQKTHAYTGGCFYMSVWDDCAWPGLLDPAKKPPQVSIWRHKVSHAEAIKALDERMERQLEVMSGALDAGEVV